MIFSERFGDSEDSSKVVFTMPNDRSEVIAVVCGGSTNGGYNNQDQFTSGRVSGNCTVQYIDDTYFGFLVTKPGLAYGSYSITCKITAKSGVEVTFKNPQSGGAVYIF